MRKPTARSGRGRRLLLLLLLTAALMVGYLTLIWFNRPVAEVYTARRGTAVSAVYGTVRIEYAYQQVVKAENTGYIDLGPNLYSGVGSVGIKIDKNQLLGTVRDEANQRQLTQANTELAAALARQKLGPPSAEGLKSAQDRLERLTKAGPSVPAAEVSAMRNNVAQLQLQVQNETNELKRQVDQASLNVKTYQELLQRAELRSPIDGYLVAAPPVDHELVFQNNPLFTIATRDLYVSGQVNEEDVGDLREGMKAELKLYAYGNRDFNAVLQAVLPNADTSNQRYTVILQMTQPPDNVRAGLTGEMNILIGKHENALLIPGSALRGPDQIFIVVNGVIAPRTVKIGYRNPETVEVLDGLKEGDLVVAADQDLFRIGQRVRAVSRNNPSETKSKSGKKL